MMILRNRYYLRALTTFTLLPACHGTLMRLRDKLLQNTLVWSPVLSFRAPAPGKNARLRLHLEVCAGTQLAESI